MPWGRATPTDRPEAAGGWASPKNGDGDADRTQRLGRSSAAFARAIRHPVTVIVLLPLLVFGRSLLPGRVLAGETLFLVYPWRAFGPPESAPGNLVFNDQVFMFHAWLSYATRELWSGRFPLWNPHAYAGGPFFANALSALLFPYSALAYILPFPAALGLAAILKVMTAGLSMYWLLRVLALQPLAALIGAVAFMFNGFLIMYLGWPITNVAIWLPLLVALTERLRQTGARRYVGWLAVVVGVQFLGGHPETSFHILVVAGCYALWRIPGPGAKRFILQFTVAGLLGGVLAAVQLVPFLEYLSESAALFYRRREADLSLTLPWRSIVALLIPNYFGSPDYDEFWGPATYFDNNGSVGVVPWILAPCALLAPWARPLTRFFLGLAAISAGVVYGVPPSLASAVSVLPGFSLALNHRLMVVLAFSLAVLGSIGMDAILRSPADARRGVLGIKVAFLLLLGVAVASLVADHEEIIARRVGLATAIQWGGFLVLLTAGTLTAIGALRHPSWRPMASVSLLALELLSLMTFAPSYNPVSSTTRFYPLTPALVHLQQDTDLFRVLLPVPNVGAVYRLSDVAGWDAMNPKHLQQLIDGKDSVGYLGNAPLRFTDNLASPLLDVLNVKYILLPPGAVRPGRKFRLDYDGPDGRIYRNADVLPRAFVVHRARTCLDGDEVLNLIRADAIDFREEVLIEGCAKWPTVAPAEHGRVRVERYEPQRVVVEADLSGSGFLILTDTYAPGWRVRVDGREGPLLRANYAFRAVPLGTGVHRVEFSYQPLSFKVGLGLTVVGLVGTGALFGPGRGRHA